MIPPGGSGPVFDWYPKGESWKSCRKKDGVYSQIDDTNDIFATKDEAPDVYETPSLTDGGTVPTTTSNVDSDEDDEEEGISRQRLHPSEARTHFDSSRVDARDVDFSDRIGGKRKSYKVSSRRTGYGDFSDEEDEEGSSEGLERKLARLRREVEEVRESFRVRNQEKSEKGIEEVGMAEGGEEQDIGALGKMLESLETSKEGPSGSAEAVLAKKLSQGAGAEAVSHAPKAQPATTGDSQKNDGSAPITYTVAYAPSFSKNHALAKAADFDSRLSLLERALGVNSSVLANLENQPSPAGSILGSVDELNRTINVLTSSSASSLDAISRRVRSLTADAEKLAEARKQAKDARVALRRAGGNPDSTEVIVNGDTPSEGLDEESTAKINALYGTLSTIESLGPLLPSVLDRLRSLRAIHADAAHASDSLAKVEKKQAEMASEITKWREGLERVEKAVKDGEGTMGRNMGTVEGWVKDLEKRMAAMPQ
jgi:nuclear migration protein JNM1